MKRSSPDLFLLNIAAVAAVMIILAMAMWNYMTLNRNSTYADWVDHTHEVIQANSQMLTEIVNAETSVRGFAVTHDQLFLQPYYEASEKVRAFLSRVRALTRDNPLQQRRVDTMGHLINSRLELLDEIIKISTNSRNAPGTLSATTLEGRLVMNQLRLTNLRFNEQETSLLETRKSDLQHEHYIALVLLIGGTIISLFFFLIAYVDLLKQMRRRIKTEKELFISREWFSKTLVSLGDAVITTNVSGIITFINHTAEELTQCNMADAVGKPLDYVFEIESETTGLPVPNPVKKALQDKKRVLLSNYTLLIRKDKTKRYIDDSAAPIFNDRRELEGAVLIFRDITDQVFTSKKLMESESRLQKIIDNSGALIHIQDVNGKYTMANRAYLTAMGLKSQSLLGKTDLPGFSPELQAVSRTNFQRALEANETITTVESGIWPDGSKHDFISVRFPLTDSSGKVTSVCGISTEITTHKNLIHEEHELLLTKAIREGEIQYKELANNLTRMFFSLDKNEKIIFWNRASELQTGKVAEDVVGKTMDLIFAKNELVILQENFRRARQSGQQQTFTIDLEISGRKETYKGNLYPSSNGFSVLMSDITAKNRASQETLQLVENLQQKNNDLRQFAFIVSHNLRAPIAKIQGLADLFPHDTEDEMNNKIITNILSELKNLDQVVTDLTDIISLREVEHRSREQISFHEELNRVTMILSDQIKTCGATITEDFEKAPVVYSIRSYMHSIFINLIGNAVKYCAAGRKLEVNVSTQIMEPFICLTVQDTGLGIDLEKHGSKLFTLYKRFHNHVEGRGIGLYMVKTQVESLGGKIEVMSKEGEGTTFNVFLPKN